MDPQATLLRADQCRQAQQWVEAVRLYRQLENSFSGTTTYHHNLALCLLGAGLPADALAQANLALAQPQPLWQSGVVKVRALTALGRPLEAAALLGELHHRYPQRTELALELATLTLHDICDARQARQLVQAHLDSPTAGTDARLTDLVASLYDRDDTTQGPDSALSVNWRAQAFAREHLDRSAQPQFQAQAQPPVARPARPPGRRGTQRVGLISPMFNSSPCYYFCGGALALLAAEFELVFFNRSHRTDWATEQLRTLATEWFDVADLAAEPLDAFVRQQGLDVLVDLGGWMDPIALKAISTKPADRLYKWVGGQSITTGLRAFDGFITDRHQTPAGFERWFTEPLVRLPLGYVTYTPPPYMPAPVPADPHRHILGVIANPVKVSQPFLAALSASLLTHSQQGLPLVLRFIDKRYHHPQLQDRIRSALQTATGPLGPQLQLEFVVPGSHQAYLSAVGQLSEMIDTFPYTGGLTTMEALSLGVACRGQVGTLFCERHTHAHLHYLQPPGSRRKRPGPVRPGAPRHSLVPPGCPRSNHAALAAALAQLFSHGSVAKVAP